MRRGQIQNSLVQDNYSMFCQDLGDSRAQLFQFRKRAFTQSIPVVRGGIRPFARLLVEVRKIARIRCRIAAVFVLGISQKATAANGLA